MYDIEEALLIVRDYECYTDEEFKEAIGVIVKTLLEASEIEYDILL